MIFSNSNQRMVFENARDLLINNGYDLRRAKLTQSEIRSEVLMSASSTKFHLPITVNDSINGNAFATEKRLQLSDVAIVYGINVQVAKPTSSTDTNFRLFNYGNLIVFSSANTAASIEAAYSNGWLSMLIDNDQTLPYWALQKHRFAPSRQQAANAYYATSAISFVDSTTGADGIWPVEPNWILSGNANFDFSLNLPGAMTAVETNSRFVVTMSIVLAQNSSKTAN